MRVFKLIFIYQKVTLGELQKVVSETVTSLIYDSLTAGVNYTVKVITISNTKSSSAALAYGITCELCCCVLFFSQLKLALD